jgi:hypothetical protein
VNRYLERVATKLNDLPTMSRTSYDGGPESNVTGAPGDLAVNIVSSAATDRLFLKRSGSGNTGWHAMLAAGQYGFFAATNTQTISRTTVEQAITFDSIIDSSGVTCSTGSSHIKVDHPGDYLIAFSGIADLAVGTNKHIEVWARVNTTDVSWSNTRVQIPGNVESTVAVTFIQDLQPSDYFQFMTSGDDTNLQWLSTVSGTSPTRPGCPSVIATFNRVS